MSLLHLRPVRRFLDARFLCAVPEREGVVALTFDDGPNPRNTPVLLDLLERKGIKATFFVLGRYVRRFGEIARRTHDEGHELANHTDRHLPLPLLPRRVVESEIRRAEDAIVEVSGTRPRFLRPPMGWFSGRTLEQIGALGYVPVIGSVNPHDSRRPPAGKIVERVQTRLSDGAIVILHDGGWHPGADRSATIEAVDRLTDELLARDVRFATLRDMTRTRDASDAGP